jgi:hypothetical protein
MRISDIHLELGVTPRREKDDSRRNLGADWHTRGFHPARGGGRRVKERVRKRAVGRETGREREGVETRTRAGAREMRCNGERWREGSRVEEEREREKA